MWPFIVIAPLTCAWLLVLVHCPNEFRRCRFLFFEIRPAGNLPAGNLGGRSGGSRTKASKPCQLIGAGPIIAVRKRRFGWWKLAANHSNHFTDRLRHSVGFLGVIPIGTRAPENSSNIAD